VLEFDERKPGAKDARVVVYCVGCDKPTVGHDPNRIKKHTKDCKVIVSIITSCKCDSHSNYSGACQELSNSS